jgi:transposase
MEAAQAAGVARQTAYKWLARHAAETRAPVSGVSRQFEAQGLGRIGGIGHAAARATRFLRRALRWFESLGLRRERVLTDNAERYRSTAFTTLYASEGVSQRFTRPYTPKTNGKDERSASRWRETVTIRRRAGGRFARACRRTAGVSSEL